MHIKLTLLSAQDNYQQQARIYSSSSDVQKKTWILSQKSRKKRNGITPHDPPDRSAPPSCDNNSEGRPINKIPMGYNCGGRFRCVFQKFAVRVHKRLNYRLFKTKALITGIPKTNCIHVRTELCRFN